MFDQDKHLISVIDLDVTLDIQKIASKVRSGTESPGIRVSSSNNQIVLSGEARNSVDADRAVSIAKSMVTTDDGKEVDPDKANKYVINAMRVAASQQVMLRVRFVEVDRTAERDLGMNWFGANKGQTAGINTGNGTSHPSWSEVHLPRLADFRLFKTLGTFVREASLLPAPFGVGLFNLAGGTSVDLLITALEDERTCAPARGARSRRSLRRYGKFSRGRRISRAFRAVLVGHCPRDHHAILPVRRPVDFRPYRPRQWNHQSAPEPFGERTRL